MVSFDFICLNKQLQFAFLTYKRNVNTLSFACGLLGSFTLLYGANVTSFINLLNLNDIHIPVRSLFESVFIQRFSICSGPRDPRSWISLSTTVKGARCTNNKGLLGILVGKTCCCEKIDCTSNISSFYFIVKYLALHTCFKIYLMQGMLSGVMLFVIHDRPLIQARNFFFFFTDALVTNFMELASTKR